jgi:alanine racemase
MTRPSQAIIDLNALRHNYSRMRTLHGGRALAVVKANAYGHGALDCARALSAYGVDGFGVAFTAEALELRTGGIELPILVLEGFFDGEELIAAATQRLWTAVQQESQLRLIEQTSLPAQSIHAWLKIDTGMHRAGFDPAQVEHVYNRLIAYPSVASVTFMTHFARSDEPDQAMTARQIAIFDQATAHLPGARSMSNSGGIIGWPQSRRDWSRPGIVLYGADPMPTHDHGLIPVMTLQSQVFAVKTIQPGETVGYGATFVADRPTRSGLVAIGYADGYPRSTPTGTPIAVDGHLTRTIGRVSMDMMSVDLTDFPELGIGSVVECWGKQIDVNLVAQASGTISYELLCNVKRVPRIYVGD